MNLSKTAGYVCNCFWLLVPILAMNLIFTRRLPSSYQADILWKDIPRAISLPENLFRALVMITPAFMRLRISTFSQRLGLWLYLTGVLVYFAAWAALICFPHSSWSTSAVGFMAPAYTPMIWLAGIGLIGNELLIPRVSFKPWIYWALSALFLSFHNLHVFRVYSRGI